MPSIHTDRIILSNIYQNGLPCVIQNIRTETLGGVAIPCRYSATDFTVQFMDDMAGQCVRIIVTCDNCGTCPPHIIEKCFCSTNGQCLNCSTCGADGFCNPICPDKICVNGNTCADCTDNPHCKNGKICSQGKCVCPGGTFENEFGQCVQCLKDGDCPNCNKCVGYACQLKDCLGKLMNPISCECVDCIDSADCKLIDPNSCCDNGKCKCCEGYYFDPILNRCVEKPDCGPGSDLSELPPCTVCIDGQLLPITCPPGKIRTSDPQQCCKDRCDCDNPNCPNPQDICVQQPTSGCYCQNCDRPCEGDGTCPNGCICNQTTRRCQNNPCDRPCDENNPCDRGCGCHPVTKRCVPCNTLSCDICKLTSGCKCDESTNNICGPKDCAGPCNSPADCLGVNCGCNPDLLICEDCDRPCESNIDCQWGCYCDKGIKRCKKNPCWKPCENGRDCDPGCGCWDNKGCYPCSSFDCVVCPNVQGCQCLDGINCAGGPRECEDDLRIVRHDDSCELEGILQTKDCCDCPEIGYYLRGTATGTDVTWTHKFKKGHTVADTDLDLTGIVNDFPLIAGRIVFSVNVYYVSGAALTVASNVSFNWANFGTNLQNFVQNIICMNGTDPVSRIDLLIKSDIDFESNSGCKYFLPAGTIVSVYGCNAGVENVIPLAKRLGCKRPLFTWYREQAGIYSEIRQAYGTPNGTNQYNDFLTGVDGITVCDKYRLEVDCGCDRVTHYSCYNDDFRPTDLTFCSPTDINANPNQALCNTEVTIDQVGVCSAMEGQVYQLFVNGTLYGNYTVVGGILFAGGIAVVLGVPITEIELRFPCDDCEICTIRKTFAVISPCNCSTPTLGLTMTSAPDCVTGFSYQITGGTFPIEVVIVKTVPPVDHEYDRFTFNGPSPGNFTFNGPLEGGNWYIKATDAYGCERRIQFNINCCDLGNPSANYDCNSQEIVISSFGSIPTEYELGGSGTWVLLSGTKRIPAVLANGTYPNYVCLRRVDNHSCTQCLTITVNCDNCNLDIQSASLNNICDTATVNTNVPWNQYSINGTGSWAAGVYPTVPLGASLLPGGSVTIYVRNSADPTCIDSVVLTCSTCGSYNIGTPAIGHDCITGALYVNGLIDPTIPALDPACSVEFAYTINGVAQPLLLLPASDWANSITLGQYEFNRPSTPVSVTITLICNNTRCFLGQVSNTFNTVDDLGIVSYNCTDPSSGLQWTGGSVAVQVFISGVWTNVLPGHSLVNGTYRVRSITAGAYCVIEKTVNVACLGGGPSGDPCVDFGAYLSYSGDPCDSSVTVTLSPSAPYSAYVSIRVLVDPYNGACTQSLVYTTGQVLLNPGGNTTFTGIPIADRDRVIYYDLVGFGGDGCKCSVLIGNCSNGSCSPVNLINSDLGCIVSGANRRLQVTNNNLVTTLVYVDEGAGMVYKATLNPAANTLIGNYSPGTSLTVRLVCLNDPTVFSGDVSITLNC